MHRASRELVSRAQESRGVQVDWKLLESWGHEPWRAEICGISAASHLKDLTMGKKNRNGNREPKKPKKPKLPVQTATSIAELSKLQNTPKKKDGK